MEMEIKTFLKAELLIAMPALTDPNFSKTVTLMCEHNSTGALGIVLNRRHPFLKAKMIFEELGISYNENRAEIPIHIGGPVHMDEIFILHGSPFNWQGCHPVTEDVAMGNTLDLLEAIGAGRGPESFFIALGCAGWGPGQLEEEMKANAWLTAPARIDIIFSLPPEKRWDAALKSIGIDPAILSSTAGSA